MEYIIKGVRAVGFQNFVDIRGTLSSLQFKETLDFLPERIFLLTAVNDSVTRGDHAHKKCKQFIYVLQGSVKVTLDNGKEHIELILNSDGPGLLLDSLIWTKLDKFSPNSSVMVIASDNYDDSDYIHNWDEFKKFADNE